MIFSSLLRSDTPHAALLPHRGRHRRHAHRPDRAEDRVAPRAQEAAAASVAAPDAGLETAADAIGLAKPDPAPAPSAGRSATATKVRIKKKRAFRVLLLVLLVAVVAAAAGAWGPYTLLRRESVRATSLEAQLAELQAELDASSTTVLTQSGDLSDLQARLQQAQANLAAARDAKVRTVVEEKVVTKEVLRWVPNGKDVSVEITGFEDLIGVQDVHLTHGYGYTNLVGIAVNKSGVEITYAQLGCTFLDAEGNVVANAMTNKQGWMPGQSWGFSCSAQTSATGGIVRVDEMS